MTTTPVRPGTPAGDAAAARDLERELAGVRTVPLTDERLAELAAGPFAAASLLDPLTRQPDVGERWEHFTAAEAEPVQGRRLQLVREAAAEFRADLVASGTPDLVRTVDLVTLPYPTRFGLFRAHWSPAAYLPITNRLTVVRWQEIDGDGVRTRTLVFEPSDIELGGATEYFAQMSSQGPAVVNKAVDRMLVSRWNTPLSALASLGIDPADVDYLAFDHLHTQDVRRLVGTTAPQADLGGEVTPLFPNARLLVQRAELESMTYLHPLQQPWYQVETFRDVDAAKVVALDGDTRLGPGVGFLSTPGHTVGNQSLVVNTDSGVWVSSEDVIATECLVPEHSAIPGLLSGARHMGYEMVLNANTPETIGQQYASMAKELAVADPAADERFPQFFPSSELTKAWWAPGLHPTYAHRGISHGTAAGAAPTSS